MTWIFLTNDSGAPPSMSAPSDACPEHTVWRRALATPARLPDPLSLARSTASTTAGSNPWLAIATTTTDKKGRAVPRIEIHRCATVCDDGSGMPPVHVLDGDAPRIARLADGSLVVVGRDAKHQRLVAWRGNADGKRWKRPARISKRDGSPAGHGTLVVGSDGALLLPTTWSSAGTFEIVCARSDDGGKSWDESAPLAVRGAADPEIAVTSDGLLLVMRVRGRIACARSRDGGRTWGTPWDAGFDAEPVPHAVLADGGALSLFWTEPVADTLCVRPWLRGVSQARSADAGTTWRRAAPLRVQPGPPPVLRSVTRTDHDLWLLVETPRGARRELAATRCASTWVDRPIGLPAAAATNGYTVDPGAVRQALATHAAWVLQRSRRANRLFVEGYYMRGLVAAAEALESTPGCDAGVDPEQLRAHAIAWAESLLSAQTYDGIWQIGYTAKYYADMAAAAALLPALEPYVGAAQLKRYEDSLQRLLGDMEKHSMRHASGAYGIGSLPPTRDVPIRTILREPYLVNTALAGIQLNAWLWKRTRKPEHRDRALAALRYTLAQISADGFREPEGRKEGVTRIAAYVQEGWMAADRDLADPAVLALLRKSLPAHVGWLLRTQGEDGAWRGKDPGEFPRTPGIVDFLVWYDQRCESRPDVRLAIRRANAFLADPARWEAEMLWRNEEGREVLRCHYGRPLAALVGGKPVR